MKQIFALNNLYSEEKASRSCQKKWLTNYKLECVREFQAGFTTLPVKF